MHSSHMVDLLDCERIIALAEHGSFAAAARALELSQPALTRAVQALERRLGAPVFVRTPSGVRPTDLGLLLLERARDLLARAREIDTAMGGARGLGVTELSVGFGPYPAAMLMEEALARFVAVAPEVAVRSFIGDWADVLQRVRAGQLDLAVLEGSLAAGDPLLETQPLREHPAYWVVRRGHPLDRGRDATLAEVRSHRVALPTRMPPRVLEPLLRDRPGDRLSPGDLGALTCPDVAMMVRLAIRLDFVTAVPLALVRRELEEGALVAIGHEPWMRTQYGLAWPKRARPPAAAAFAEILTQVDERFPDLSPSVAAAAHARSL